MKFGAFFVFLVLSAGIEPTLRDPQSRVLSVELREDIEAITEKRLVEAL